MPQPRPASSSADEDRVQRGRVPGAGSSDGRERSRYPFWCLCLQLRGLKPCSLLWTTLAARAAKILWALTVAPHVLSPVAAVVPLMLTTLPGSLLLPPHFAGEEMEGQKINYFAQGHRASTGQTQDGSRGSGSGAHALSPCCPAAPSLSKGLGQPMLPRAWPKPLASVQ